MLENILIVCVGNICRSPLAEAVLKRLTSLHVSSAGVRAMKGFPADPEVVRLGEKHGYDLSSHKASQLNASMCRGNDLIIVMEKIHFNSVFRISPESRGKVVLLGKWEDQKEIPDPYNKSSEFFAKIYSSIHTSARKWQEKMKWL